MNAGVELLQQLKELEDNLLFEWDHAVRSWRSTAILRGIETGSGAPTMQELLQLAAEHPDWTRLQAPLLQRKELVPPAWAPVVRFTTTDLGDWK